MGVSSEHRDPQDSDERQIVNAVQVPDATTGMFGDLPIGPVRQAYQASPLALWASASEHKRMILLTFLIVAGSIVAMLWLLMAPQYRAGAEIRVRPIIPRLVYRTDDNGRIPLYESFMNTQSAVLSSPTVLQRVLEEPAVQATDWFEGRRRGPLGFLRGQVLLFAGIPGDVV